MILRVETRAAITAARAAGRILDRWFGRAGPVRLKGSRDPVTRADGASERVIRQILGRRFLVASNGRIHDRIVALLNGRRPRQGARFGRSQ